MRSFLTLFRKEWLQHRWRVLGLFAISLIIIAFVGMKMGKMVDFLPGGVLSVVMYFWQVVGVLLVSSTLANGAVVSDYKSRTQEFLEGLPLKRWMNLSAKFLFVFLAVTLISTLLFLTFAIRSSQFGVRGWEAITFPLLRMTSLNFAVTAAAFFVALLGKFRWYLYLAVGAALMVASAGVYSLGSNLPPFHILEAEQTMGEFDRFPWIEFGKNALIGFGFLILSVGLAYLLRGKFQRGVANKLGMRDWIIFLMGFSTLILFAAGVVMKEGQEDIDYKLDYGSAGEATVGETLVKLNIQNVDASKEETTTDIAELQRVAEALEDARLTLAPPWWPASWVIIRDSNAETNPRKWTTAVSGDSFVLIADWDEGEDEKNYPRRWEKISSEMLTNLFWEMTFGETHRDRYGWIHDGLASHIIERHYPGHIEAAGLNKAKKPPLERFTEESLTGWFHFTKERWGKVPKVGSVALLAEIEERLGKEGFANWLHPIVARTYAKPQANTIYSINRGLIYWKGIFGGDEIDFSQLGTKEELITAAKSRIVLDPKTKKRKKSEKTTKKSDKPARTENREDKE